ncbi:MAG: heme exporter protein CcmB [Thermoflavifilum sp.]|nr:heme exporter protein CcmB [Thermoflavifilum sp.]
MHTIRQIVGLVKKDLMLEWRQKYTFYGLLLYAASTVFVMYMLLHQPADKVWNALFWITLLFISVNAVAKSFLQETAGRMLFYHQLCSPEVFMIGKMLYHVLLMAFMSVVCWLLYLWFLGNPLIKLGYFVGICLLGGSSLGIAFSLLAAVASRAGQSAALMAILGFPIMIPLLLLLTRVSQVAFQEVYQPGLTKMFWMLGSLDVFIVALSLILYPFLWKN